MDPRITWAVTHIREQLASPLSIPQLAARVNLSTSRFAHLFRRDVGTSPARFQRAVRMARARLLLERTFLSVKEVMALVGCNDPSHFSRDFRAVHGMAPRPWRNAYGERRESVDETRSTAARASAAVTARADSAYVPQNSPKSGKRPREPGSLSLLVVARIQTFNS